MSRKKKVEISLPLAAQPNHANKYHFEFKNEYQKEAWNIIDKHEITILLGGAGSGKTTLATAYAVDYVLKHKARNLFITRPHVLTEKIGFIPGDINQKLDPLLRPITDALDMMCPQGQDRRFVENTLKIESIAYLRGATLNGIALGDECQNMDLKTIVLFLTRLGKPPKSKMILTADPWQSDLPNSGIHEICKYLQGVEGVAIYQFPKSAQCRNPVVQNIINAIPKEISQ
jgi:phosphate starvation-inducible PhoH-like protein